MCRLILYQIVCACSQRNGFVFGCVMAMRASFAQLVPIFFSDEVHSPPFDYLPAGIDRYLFLVSVGDCRGDVNFGVLSLKKIPFSRRYLPRFWGTVL